MVEFIQHEPHDETAWICLCGNTPDADGFTPSDVNGETIEPTTESRWDGIYRCDRCLRIIAQRNLKVINVAPKSYRFMWQGIEIEAIYTPFYCGVVAHLQIRSIAPEGAPLPITSTGYHSYFHQPGTVEAKGCDVVAQVIAWLDEEAATPEGWAQVEAGKQGELF